MQPPHATNHLIIALVALGALGGELFIGFPLLFSPGWANGWPGGLTIYRVFSAFLTVYLSVLMMTAGIGAGALITFLLCRFPSARRRSALLFCTWLVLWAGITNLTCVRAYHEIYASTLEMWPNGYPNRIP